jgi:hypothetical protein
MPSLPLEASPYQTGRLGPREQLLPALRDAAHGAPAAAQEQALTAFLKESPARCYVLFDGLNEVPPPHRDTLIGELTRWLMTYPRHPVVVTSRPQDELWRQIRGELDRALVVQPISDDQAQAYLVDHLKDKGSDLYACLDDRLRERDGRPDLGVV